MNKCYFQGCAAFRCLTCLMAIYVGLLVGWAHAAEVFDEEAKALEARRKIISADITIRGKYDLYIPPQTKPDFSRQIELACFIDGRKLRNDETFGDPSTANSDSYRVTSSFNDTTHISYSTQVLTDGTRLATEAKPVASVDPVAALKVDPRVIGTSPNSVLNLSRKRLDTVLGRPDRKVSSIRDEALNGEQCRVVSYTRNDGAEISIWIVPTKDYGVEKIRLEFKVGEQQYVDLIECSLERDDGSGLWFPKSYHFRREIDEHVNEEEIATVEVQSINKQLPSQTFDFEGIGVPIGTEVTVFDSSGVSRETWDGSKLEAIVHESALPPAEWTVRRRLLMALTILAILITTTLLILRRRKSDG